MREKLRHYQELIPVLVICIALVVITLIALKVIGYGFLPIDDALRHAAKIISGKPLNEILVMRSEIKMDPHAGWHAILGLIHRITGWNQDGLVVFSVVTLFILFCLIPVFFLERPEAWLVTLLGVTLVNIALVRRLFFGRPYIIPMSVILVLSFLWPRLRDKKFPYKIVIAIAGLIGLSTWTHCVWYLFILPIAAFLVAREWRAALRLGIATVCGILLGICFTGHPYIALRQSITHLFLVVDSNVPRRVLVYELQPFTGDILTLIAVSGLLMWRYMRGAWNKKCVDNPVFILAACGWVLGFFVVRFWFDWGMPALMVWMALEVQDSLKRVFGMLSWRRVWVMLGVAIALFFALTNDSQSRWTYNLTTEYLSQDNPGLKGWLPEPGGIVYSDDMTIFYQTFFKNPKAPWRYILGCESAWMPPEDLAILRNIQWNFSAYQAFEPWVKKMRRQDRLIIRHPPGQSPKISGLEWHYGATGIWIGRLPRD